jgi:hypothetical protein
MMRSRVVGARSFMPAAWLFLDPTTSLALEGAGDGPSLVVDGTAGGGGYATSARAGMAWALDYAKNSFLLEGRWLVVGVLVGFAGYFSNLVKRSVTVSVELDRFGFVQALDAPSLTQRRQSRRDLSLGA